MSDNQSDNANEIRLESTQKSFMDFLQGLPSQFAEQVQPGGAIDIETRLNIYANAYRMRFIETIETDHEILGLYLGDQLFDTMAEGYIKTHPSNYTSLRQYADSLPEYLAKTEPFSSHPVIAELAKFERLLLVAFDARDMESIDFSAMTELAPESWPEVTCRFHPSVQLFSSEWNSVDIWNALKKEVAPDTAVKQQVSWLIWRNSDRLTQFKSIDSLERTMLTEFLHGKNFAQVCDSLSTIISHQEVPSRAFNILRSWFEKGLIVNVQTA